MGRRRKEYQHGTYQKYRQGCTAGEDGGVCDDCTTAARTYWLERKQEQRERETGGVMPESAHGTRSGHTNWGCECGPCMFAANKGPFDMAAWREEHREEHNAHRRWYYHNVELPRIEAEERAARERRLRK